jgi:hypothetical protein
MHIAVSENAHFIHRNGYSYQIISCTNPAFQPSVWSSPPSEAKQHLQPGDNESAFRRRNTTLTIAGLLAEHVRLLRIRLGLLDVASVVNGLVLLPEFVLDHAFPCYDAVEVERVDDRPESQEGQHRCTTNGFTPEFTYCHKGRLSAFENPGPTRSVFPSSGSR